MRTGRHFVGYDTDQGYVDAARARIEAARSEGPRVGADLSAKDRAQEAIAYAGYTEVRSDVRLPGAVDVSFAAVDRTGRSTLFDLCGAFSSTRGGLKRADVLWRAIGKASVIHQRDPQALVVLLTTDRPAPGSAGAQALDAVVGPERPIADVIDLTDPADVARLASRARG